MQKINEAIFKQALGQFASGVTVITASNGNEDCGMTASAFCSLSLDPPLVLVCVKKGNTMWNMLQDSSGYGVTILGEDQQEWSNRFAGGTVDASGNWIPWPEERSRFEGIDCARAEMSGARLLPDALAQLDCVHEAQFDGGDHTIFVGRVVGANAKDRGEGNPLVYQAGGYKKLEK